MKKIMVIIGFLLLLGNIDLYSRDIRDCAIIQGMKVRCRENPAINSRIIKEFIEGELVFDPVRSEKKTKIGPEEEYWYKVKTQDRKEGWVFGKYILVFDKNDELQKEYLRVINTEFDLTYNSKATMISKVRIEKDDKYGYMLLRYIYEDSTYLVFFKKDGDNFKKVIDHGTADEKYFINDNFIYLWVRGSIRIYDRNKLVKSSVNDKNMLYKWVGALSPYTLLKKKNIKGKNTETFDSYIEFEPETCIVTVHLREKKGEPMKIEKYIFQDGEFRQVK